MTERNKRNRNAIKQAFFDFFSTKRIWQYSYKRPNLNELQISNISFIHNQNGSIEIELTLGRAGLFIGTQGNTIRDFENYIFLVINEKVKFKIVDSKIWEFEKID